MQSHEVRAFMSEYLKIENQSDVAKYIDQKIEHAVQAALPEMLKTTLQSHLQYYIARTLEGPAYDAHFGSMITKHDVISKAATLASKKVVSAEPLNMPGNEEYNLTMKDVVSHLWTKNKFLSDEYAKTFEIMQDMTGKMMFLKRQVEELQALVEVASVAVPAEYRTMCVESPDLGREFKVEINLQKESNPIALQHKVDELPHPEDGKIYCNGTVYVWPADQRPDNLRSIFENPSVVTVIFIQTSKSHKLWLDSDHENKLIRDTCCLAEEIGTQALLVFYYTLEDDDPLWQMWMEDRAGLLWKGRFHRTMCNRIYGKYSPTFADVTSIPAPF